MLAIAWPARTTVRVATTVLWLPKNALRSVTAASRFVSEYLQCSVTTPSGEGRQQSANVAS